MPGIGKRTAERIVVELREKVGATAGAGPQIVVTRADDPREAERLLAGAQGTTTEELLAAALREARR